MTEVLAEGERAGALACFLSGAGPTLLALVEGEGAAIGERMAARWREAAGIAARPFPLSIDRAGARIERRDGNMT